MKRLLWTRGFPEIIQVVEAPLPVFIAIDPSYKYFFNTASLRLTAEKYKREALDRSKNYKNFLTAFNCVQLGADKTLVGLTGSPTIVYNVQRVPKGKVTRRAEVLDGTKPENIRKAIDAMKDALSAMVIK